MKLNKRSPVRASQKKITVINIIAFCEPEVRETKRCIFNQTYILPLNYFKYYNHDVFYLYTCMLQIRLCRVCSLLPGTTWNLYNGTVLAWTFLTKETVDFAIIVSDDSVEDSSPVFIDNSRMIINGFSNLVQRFFLTKPWKVNNF